MRVIRTFGFWVLGAGLALAATGRSAAAEAPSVVVSIKPIHSLVAGVMDGIGTPGIIVEGAGSPHTASLKPSKAAAIEAAGVVFWVGHELETFLEGPLESLAGKAHVISLIDAPDLVRHEIREGGAFEGHADHDGHGHGHGHEEAKHDEHDHDKSKNHDGHGHGHGHGEAKHTEADHGDGEHHDETDAHIWLDPANAKAIVAAAAKALAEADPANGGRYMANAAALQARLDGLTTDIETIVAPVRERPFIVFHDAYQYFEHRFGLAAAGSITTNPEVAPGAERVTELRAKVRELGAVCVFSEPQFSPKIVSVITEGTGARTGVLDPLGADIAAGPEHYFTLMKRNAEAIRDCLTPAS
ncbi:MAG: zinc ABC transporter substrate-binding protein [Rhizobiales bacterium]|nr:zinc ABC transporter substrate-binding protein [Hyphomicrobiales bacterium]